MLRTIVMNRLLIGLLSWLTLTTAQAARPLWMIVPVPGSSPTQTVPPNSTSAVLYIVQNQSGKPKKVVIQPIPGITQTAPCQLAPKGQAGSSCVLNLAIIGSALPQGGIHGGPNLCQANPDGSPNPNQCYRPSPAHTLNITKGASNQASLSVTGGPLSLVAGCPTAGVEVEASDNLKIRNG